MYKISLIYLNLCKLLRKIRDLNFLYKTLISVFSDFLSTFIYTYLFSCTNFRRLRIKKSIPKFLFLLNLYSSTPVPLLSAEVSLSLGFQYHPECTRLYLGEITLFFWDTQWRCWLRHCATSWKVAGSIPNGIIGIFH